MKVFTSVFVLDGVRTTLEDFELSVRTGQNELQIVEETDGMRRRIVELQARIGQRRDQAQREEA